MKRGPLLLAPTALLVAGAGWFLYSVSKGDMKTQSVKVEITDETVASDDAWALIEPVWNAGDIYGSVAEYEQSLMGFSTQQRSVASSGKPSTTGTPGSLRPKETTPGV